MEKKHEAQSNKMSRVVKIKHKSFYPNNRAHTQQWLIELILSISLQLVFFILGHASENHILQSKYIHVSRKKKKKKKKKQLRLQHL